MGGVAAPALSLWGHPIFRCWVPAGCLLTQRPQVPGWVRGLRCGLESGAAVSQHLARGSPDSSPRNMVRHCCIRPLETVMPNQGRFLPLRGHLAMSADWLLVLSQTGVGRAASIQGVGARDAAKHPTRLRTTRSRESSSHVECQESAGEKPWYCTFLPKRTAQGGLERPLEVKSSAEDKIY